jgi:hypothetical protein
LFQPNRRIYEANAEAYKKFTESLILPNNDKKPGLIKAITNFVFKHVKDHSFDDVNWDSIELEDLKLDD